MGKTNNFYELVSETLQEGNYKSVDVYSVSTCFGFYSQGMKNFSKFLKTIKESLLKPEFMRVEEMRLLLMVDRNPIDDFAISRISNPQNLLTSASNS